MAILGLTYKRITAERTNIESPDAVQINTMPKITGIEKTQIKGMGPDMDVLNVTFIFESDFKPQIGTLKIEGNLLYNATEEQKKEVLKLWKQDKRLPAETGVEIINYLFRKTSILSLQIGDALQLPPVIGMPRLEKRVEEEPSVQKAKKK